MTQIFMGFANISKIMRAMGNLNWGRIRVRRERIRNLRRRQARMERSAITVWKYKGEFGEGNKFTHWVCGIERET